ncbi:MAG: hypothetical protein JW940_36205 [Polyangiaceae bacterium]|nr:hypothetical protein [Polyangiaceae bacterium]
MLVFAALCGLVAPLAVTGGAAQAGSELFRPDVMPVEDVKPGMKGYGLTVFEGTRPERFDVEVIDVLRNFRPRQDLILIKTHHPRLDITRVVAGMSGSPVFIDGKMIGAYAYGWTFGIEPVAGVTPIQNMLAELVRPLPSNIYGWPLRPSRAPRGVEQTANNAYRGAPASYDLAAHARQVARNNATHGQLAPVATPLLIGGMSAGGIEALRSLLGPLGLEPMQAGGGGEIEPDSPTHFSNGSAIGVQLIRGDVSAMGLGTVTRVEGDKLVAFGHPMMQSGVTAIPTSLGRVLWLLASEQRSFKLGMPVRPIGAMVNDRTASIVVSQNTQAPSIPVTLNIRGLPGAGSRTWHFQVAHERFMSPSFIAVALGSALQTDASERQDVSWNALSRLKIRGRGEIELKDYGVSVGGTPDTQEFVQSNLVDAVGALLNNPWEPVIIEEATMDIELRYAREMLRLRGAELLDSEVEAGQDARVRLVLVPYAGPQITKVISIPIPRQLAGEDVKLTIRPGYLEARDRPEPENVSELVKVLVDPFYPAKSLVVTYDSGAGSVAYKGQVARELPPGAVDLINATTSSVFPAPFSSVVRHVVPLDEFMVGQDTVTVTVKPILR